MAASAPKQTPARPRSIIVTGAGSGIGAAIARRIAAADVGLLIHTKQNTAGAERVAEAARAKGAGAEIVLGDMAEAEMGRRLVEAAVAAFGGLDAIVSNAGFSDRQPVDVLDRKRFDEGHAAMPGALFELASAGLPYLKAGRHPRILAISSHNAHLFRNDYPVFPGTAPAKAAIEALVRVMAIELAPHGITVNAVAPGLIRKDVQTETSLSTTQWNDLTAKIPLGRLGEADEVAALAAFLLSPEAGYITGQIMHVNGGLI
jgi:NAD(P)-dependent dehydrogenase (short-subunit alcohol dehydrogenase family)